MKKVIKIGFYCRILLFTEVFHSGVTETCAIKKQCSENNCFEELERFIRKKSCDELIVTNQSSTFTMDYITNNFKNLTALKIKFSDINELYSRQFEGLEKLNLLKITHSKIETISKDALINLGELRHLRVGFNKLKKIDEILFHSKLLIEFYGRQNQISKIDPETFKNNTELKRISLSNNLIENLDARLFKGLFELKFLNLSSNFITVIEARLFDDNQKLINVDLSDNRIAVIEWKSVVKLTELAVFNLTNNTCIDMIFSFQNVHLIRDEFSKCNDSYNSEVVESIMKLEVKDENHVILGKNIVPYLVIIFFVYLLIDLICALVLVVRNFSKVFKNDTKIVETHDEFEWSVSMNNEDYA